MLIEARSRRAPQYSDASDRRLRILAGMPWWHIAAGLALIVAVAAVARWERSRGLAVIAAVACGCLLVSSTVAWRRLAAAMRAAQPLDRHWTITDQDLRVTGGGSTRTWRWAAVIAVDVRPGEYLFRQDGGIGFDLPRDALTEAQDDELRQFLGTRNLL